MKVAFFHVNPPEQRGKKRAYKSRATFAGVIQDGRLKIGMSFCHGVDQFCRKTGRTKAAGKALVDPNWIFDLQDVEERNHNDFFVTQCRGICDSLKMNHDYTRRKKRVRQVTV